mgnify:CR=1 FL=1
MNEFAPPQTADTEVTDSYELPSTGLSVMRSSGKIDEGWELDPDYNPSDTLVKVTKTDENGQVLTKAVDKAALIELQKNIAAEKQKKVFAPPQPNSHFALGESGASVGEANAVLRRAAEITEERKYEAGEYTPYSRTIMEGLLAGRDVSDEHLVNKYVVPEAREEIAEFKPKVQ